MLKIMVKYFLNDQGIKYFQKWYQEVYDITSKQDGFIKMSFEINRENPIVCLYFDSEEKLSEWASTETHDNLAAKIEPYLTKPQEVNVAVTDINTQ